MSRIDCRKIAGHDADVRAVFALGVWSAITLVVVVLMSRRASGAFSVPTAAWVPCFAASCAAVLSLAAFAVWTAVDSSAARLLSQIIAASVAVIPPLGLGIVLWSSPSIFVGGYLTFLVVITSLAAFLIRDLSASVRPLFEPGRLPRMSGRVPDISSDLGAFQSGAVVPECAADAPTEEVDATILQQFTRRRSPLGRELVEGAVRISFASGERLAAAHVAFVPPLGDRPNVECHVLTDFDGRARVAAAHAYGLRIEARRNDDVSESIVDVAFTAEVAPTQASAA